MLSYIVAALSKEVSRHGYQIMSYEGIALEFVPMLVPCGGAPTGLTAAGVRTRSEQPHRPSRWWRCQRVPVPIQDFRADLRMIMFMSFFSSSILRGPAPSALPPWARRREELPCSIPQREDKPATLGGAARRHRMSRQAGRLATRVGEGPSLPRLVEQVPRVAALLPRGHSGGRRRRR